MLVTSQQANKLLKRINSDINYITSTEMSEYVFTAATTENANEVRPDYDFVETEKKLSALRERVRVIKHALNVFNSTTCLDGLDLTIDQALIYLPQLNANLSRLSIMRQNRGGRRVNGNVIDYTYLNYDLGDVEKAYELCADTIAQIQQKLNLVNATAQFEIPD